jgi:uridine kinase
MAPQTFLIGIAGPSGAGKSFLARHLAEKLHAPVLSLDHYYRDLSHLSLEDRAGSNFDEPAALEHELLIAQVADLHEGRTIAIPTYDFSIHTRACRTQAFQPAAFVIIEGLFTLHWAELRRLLGTKVYVEMADDICLQRRTERDVQERGRTAESVVAQFRTTVAPMAGRYVRPTLQRADVVIPGSMPIDQGVARVLEHIGQQARHHDMKSALDHLSSLDPVSAH